MTPNHFFYDVKADVTLDMSEIETIITCGLTHYNAKCKAAVKQGGFVFGWRNMIEMGFQTVTMTYSNVDTVAKILENHGFGDEERSAKAEKLRLQFAKLLQRLNKEYATINADDAVKPIPA